VCGLLHTPFSNFLSTYHPGRRLRPHLSSRAKPRGSDGSAASGGISDLSEWQRSAESKPASTGAAFAGHRNRILLRLFAAKIPRFRFAPLGMTAFWEGKKGVRKILTPFAIDS